MKNTDCLYADVLRKCISWLIKYAMNNIKRHWPYSITSDIEKRYVVIDVN